MNLIFSRGTILIRDSPEGISSIAQYDERIQAFRAPAYEYVTLKKEYPDAEDMVFEGQEDMNLSHSEKLRAYQQKAIDMWSGNGMRGIVVLPTAAGKTHIGIDAIARLSVSTIIISPTIELIQQWKTKLQNTLGIEVGQIGGGEKDIKPITVCTYDSAYLMAEELGNRFKFLLVDEVHHLASERYGEIARMFASPFRLGLTATFERLDMLHEKLETTMGGKIFELGYEELTEFLAGYDIVRIPVDLEQEEEE